MTWGSDLAGRGRGRGGLRRLGDQMRKALPYLFSERRRALERHRLERIAFDSDLLSMGCLSYGEPLVAVSAATPEHVHAGSFVSIGLDVMFLDGGNHNANWVTTFPLRIRLGLPGGHEDGQPFSKGDIVIGNDVWIGSYAHVLSGVTIGDGAIIGSRSVVAKDVRPYAIVVGNPAREIRRRFSDEQVDALLEIAWWDWPMSKIVDQVSELCGPDIDRFIARNAQR